GGPVEGRVYVAWSELDDSRPTARIVFARSLSTSPLVFSRTMALSSSDALNQGAMPAVGPDGELYVVWGRFVWSGTSVASESIRLLKSIDGGISFTNPDSADPSPNKTVAIPAPTPDVFSSASIPIRTRGFPCIA